MKNTINNSKQYLLLLLSIITLLTPLCAQETRTKGVAKNTVCMVDDQYKGEEQLTTSIDGKIYYGCCIPCIETLHKNASFRYAIDPFSAKKISKADAFIAKKTEQTDAIFYFESEKNYINYVRSIK